jgi:hypothetical protein
MTRLSERTGLFPVILGSIAPDQEQLGGQGGAVIRTGRGHTAREGVLKFSNLLTGESAQDDTKPPNTD